MVALGATGACGGPGDDGAGPPRPEASTSSTPGASSTGPTAGTTPATAGTTSAPRVRPGGPEGGEAAGSTGPSGTGAAPQSPPAATEPTPPGTYRYTTSGSFSSTPGGPPQPRNGESTLVVEPPVGPDQRSVHQGPGRTTEQVLRIDAGGAHLVFLRRSEQGIVKEIRPSPPALALPADAVPGRSWSWRATSTDGQTVVDAGFRAVRTEDVTVGPDRVTALVVEAVVSTTGDIVSTSRQTLWVSLRHRLVVRQDDTTDGRVGAIAFTSTSSDRLMSLVPS